MLTNSRYRSLGNVAAAAGGTTIYNLSQWLLLIAVARLADPESVGLYSYALAVTAPLALLFGLNLRQSYITEELDGDSFSAYYRLRLTTSVALLAVYVVLGFVLGVSGTVIIAVGLSKTIDLLTDFLAAPLQKTGYLVGIGVAQALNGITTLLCVVGALLVGLRPDIAMATTVIGSIVGGVYSIWLLRKRQPKFGSLVRLRWWKAQSNLSGRLHLRRLLFTLLPLGLAAGFTSARVTFPRYVLEATWGLSEIGIYSAALHITVAANALVGAVAQLYLPKLVSLLKSSGRPALRKPVALATLIWLVGGALVTVAAFYSGPQVLALVYGPDYAVDDLMGVLAIAWGLSSGAAMVELGIIAQRRFSPQSSLNLVALGATAIASFFIIPDFGMVGAAWVGVISAAVLLLINSAYFTWVTRPHPQEPSV